jgi:uncharacterized coiled-coil DUF342 family protein
MTELIAQIKEAEENFKRMKEQRDLLITELKNAKAQLEYLDDKFQKTGTTATTIARIDYVLNKVGVK